MGYEVKSSEPLIADEMEKLREAVGSVEPGCNYAEVSNALAGYLLANREALCAAFVAETGLLPSECEIVEERIPMRPDYVMRVRVIVRKKGA